MGAASKAREARIRPYSTAEQRRWQCPAAAESGELFRGRSLAQIEGIAMPRITEIDDADTDPTLARVFARERKVFGELLNPTRVMAHCPPIFETAKTLYAAFEVSALLPASLLALVYVRVATINGCLF
jgi:alkylhydroperoxidase family enzyme